MKQAWAILTKNREILRMDNIPAFEKGPPEVFDTKAQKAPKNKASCHAPRPRKPTKKEREVMENEVAHYDTAFLVSFPIAFAVFNAVYWPLVARQ